MGKRIVAITLNHIGDVLFTEPAIAAIRAGHPSAQLIVVTSPTAKAVLEHHPNIDEIWQREHTVKGWWSLAKKTQGNPTIYGNLLFSLFFWDGGSSVGEWSHKKIWFFISPNHSGLFYRCHLISI